MPPNTNPSRPNQLGPVVAAQHRGVAALGGQAIQLTNQVIGGDGSLDQPTQAFAGVLVDDGHDLDRPPIGGGVELKIHCLAHPPPGLSLVVDVPRRLRRRRCGTRKPSSRHSRYTRL